MTADGAGPTVLPRVVLGVAGGIAAYKACSVLRLLTESGHDVRVVPTAAALEFVGAATWAALSGHPVSSTVWEDVEHVPHVRLGQQADLVLVAPATADLLARAAHGRADDLLAATLLTARCPVLLAPAMHSEMWLHPATRANVATLRSRGVIVLDPASGRLTGTDTGPGRLPDPEAIVAAGLRLLARGASVPDLVGVHVVVSAGGTREPLDPVRYLGNRSSGRQGFALAEAALARGARVTLVAAHADVPPPAGVDLVPVSTALELREAVLAAAKDAGVVVMAAAVADFRPDTVAEHKLKKSDTGDAPTIRLVRNPDVLAELVTRRDADRAGRSGRPGPVEPLLVGFAAETGDGDGTVLEHARRKLARKGCDLLVVNDVSGGRVFGRTRTEVTVLVREGGAVTELPLPPGPKEQVADAVWDLVAARLRRGPD